MEDGNRNVPASSERILFHEYGTQLRLCDVDKLVLNVLCGRVGQYGVEFELNEIERSHYRATGDTFIQELAEMVRKEPKPYLRRGRSC